MRSFCHTFFPFSSSSSSFSSFSFFFSLSFSLFIILLTYVIFYSVVVVGEGGVGKTCLLITQTTSEFPVVSDIPTNTVDNYTYSLPTEKHGVVNIGLWGLMFFSFFLFFSFLLLWIIILSFIIVNVKKTKIKIEVVGQEESFHIEEQNTATEIQEAHSHNQHTLPP